MFETSDYANVILYICLYRSLFYLSPVSGNLKEAEMSRVWWPSHFHKKLNFYLPNSCHGNESPPESLPSTFYKGWRKIHRILTPILQKMGIICRPFACKADTISQCIELTMLLSAENKLSAGSILWPSKDNRLI